MARKTKTLTITTKNRDEGKTFLITEMDSERAEDWMFRALQALAASGIDIGDNPRAMSAAKMAEIGLGALAKAAPETVKGLKAEMLECVELVSAERKDLAIKFVPAIHAEEVTTLFALYSAVLELHLGFSFSALVPTLA